MGLLCAAAVALAAAAVASEPDRNATLYKNPDCDCCDGYADYLRRSGFTVAVKPTHDLSRIKREQGVPERLDGCHTTLVGGYVVEGHVPVGPIDRLLAERPAIRGISLPDMPPGSPGMTGRKAAPFVIYEFGGGMPKVYAVE
jgi:hypothetical protein